MENLDVPHSCSYFLCDGATLPTNLFFNHLKRRKEVPFRHQFSMESKQSTANSNSIPVNE